MAINLPSALLIVQFFAILNISIRDVNIVFSLVKEVMTVETSTPCLPMNWIFTFAHYHIITFSGQTTSPFGHLLSTISLKGIRYQYSLMSRV